MLTNWLRLAKDRLCYVCQISIGSRVHVESSTFYIVGVCFALRKVEEFSPIKSLAFYINKKPLITQLVTR